ncbi:MAG: PAS domain-containing protein [Kiloniellaceae bacterium]
MPDFVYSDYFLKELGDLEPPAIHARFLAMIRYMKKVAPRGALPGRQHIDPVEFRQVLTLVNLVDVERTGGKTRFRFRLVGEQQTRAAGRSITGLVVEDAVIPELAPRITANMTQVLARRLPVYDSFAMPHPDRQFIDSQRMYFPLAADGRVIDKLLILNGYDRMPLRAAI